MKSTHARPWKNKGLDTLCVHAGEEDCASRVGSGAVAPAIYQTSTFVADKDGGYGKFAYSRVMNPTLDVLEAKVAALHGSRYCCSTSSGLAAINLLFFAFLQNGKHVVASNALYGPVRHALEHRWRKFGVSVTFVDIRSLQQVEEAIQPTTVLIYLESPSNPTLRVGDIAGISEIAHKKGCLVAVDNTFMSPILQRPLELGADFVVESATKFLGGHSDVLGGVVVSKCGHRHGILVLARSNVGCTPDPHQAWLIARGIKTLRLRVLACQSNATALKRAASVHPAVKNVLCPDPPEVHARQAAGDGAVFALELVGGMKAAQRARKAMCIILPATSLGAVESLCDFPCHGEGSIAEQSGIHPGLLRVAVGIEDVDDLLCDLLTALDAAGPPLNVRDVEIWGEEREETKEDGKEETEI